MNNKYTIRQEYLVYKIKEKKVYPVCESDWERIKRMIRNIVPHKRIYQIFANIFIGICISSAFSLVAFNAAEKIAPWVLPAMWCIFSVSLLLSIALLFLDSQQKTIISTSAGNVITEMMQIEEGCDRSSSSDEDKLL